MENRKKEEIKETIINLGALWSLSIGAGLSFGYLFGIRDLVGSITSYIILIILLLSSIIYTNKCIKRLSKDD